LAAEHTSEPDKYPRSGFAYFGAVPFDQGTLPSHESSSLPYASAHVESENPLHIPSQSTKLEIFNPSQFPVPSYPPTSALELAQEAAELAFKTQSSHSKPSGPSEDVDGLRTELEHVKFKYDIVKWEREQLRLERDEARVESEKYRVERDKVTEQRDAEAETCRELRKEVERLKKALKDRDENADKVLELTIASLQSLRGSSLGHPEA
jgi:hypothetical protein